MDGNEARRQLFVPLASKRRNAEVITSRSAGRLPGLADAPRFVYGSTVVRNPQKNLLSILNIVWKVFLELHGLVWTIAQFYSCTVEEVLKDILDVHQRPYRPYRLCDCKAVHDVCSKLAE